jgi:hypothetical protein
MTTRRRSKESRVGIAATWLATIGGLVLVAGSLLLGQYAWGNAMEGVQTSGWFTCRDEACVQQAWLTAGFSVVYALGVVTLILMAHRATPRALRLTVAIGFLGAAALAAFGLLTMTDDDVAGLAALVLATVPALLALGSLLRVRARAGGYHFG